MKLYKYLFLSLVALCFTACSDDDNDWNSASGVEVSMANPTIEVRESQGLFNVPLVVTGDANGPIQVTVKVLESGSEPAMDNVHYIVTSKTVTIPETVKTVNVEIKTVDNSEENEARTFDVVIEDVKGASVGAVSTTAVTLKDDDADPYIKLLGNWIFTANDPRTGDPVQFNLTMQTPNPSDEDEAEYYGKELYAFGFDDTASFYLTFSYKYNEATTEGKMAIQIGSLMCNSIINFGFDGILVSATYNEQGNLSLSGSIPCMWNDDFTEITFEDPSAILVAAALTYPEQQYMGFTGRYTNMKLVRSL